MKKLRLEVETVRVESFVVAGREPVRGTVRGHESYEDTCHNTTCNTGITAMAYCPTAYDETCNGWPGCGATGETTGYTNGEGTCSAYGCTACNMWC